MAVDNWPSTVPSCFIHGSHNEQLGDGLLRSQMDTGPAKIRRRSSAMPRSLVGTLRLTDAQRTTLVNFIQGTLLGGSLPFIMKRQGGNGRIMARLSGMPSWQRVTGNTYLASLSFEVLADLAPLPPVFDTTAMPSGREAVPYSWRPTVIEGTRPFQAFAITAGALPPGVTLDTSTGLISGTAPDFGTFNFTLRVTDADGRMASVSRSLVVQPPGFIFANGEILDPTFTRASNATYWGRDGIMRVAANNVPRFDHDPLSGVFRGVLMEEARTNICLNFQAFNTTRAAMASIANDRGLNLFRFTPDTSAASSHQSIYSASFAALTVDTLAAVSVIVKQDGAATSRIALRLADTVGFLVYIYFDIATGTFVNTPSSSVVPFYTATNLGGGYWELKLVYVIRSTSTYATLQLYAASPDGAAVTTYNFNGSDSYIVAHPQIEIGTFPTSYIPTTTAAATRAAEAMTVAAGPWLNVSASTVVFEGDTYRTLTAGAGDRATMFFFNGSSQNSFEAFFSVNGAFQIVGSGATLGGAGRLGPSPATNQRTKVALSYGGGTVKGTVDAGPVGQVSDRPSPLDINTLYVGYRGGNGRHLNGHIRSLAYTPRRMTDEELQKATQ